MLTTYTGKLVRIRPLVSGEEAFYCTCEGCQHTHEHWGPMWCPRPKELKDFAEAGYLGDDLCAFAVDRLDTGELVGYELAELGKQGPLACELGTFIMERHQHQGFGIEAKLLNLCFLFENFNFTQVWAVTLETHKRARRGIELTGMEHRGVKRRAHFSRGRWRDELIYTMTRQQWLSHPIRGYVRRGSGS